MTEQEKLQKAKELSAALYSCLNHIEECEAELKKQYARMHEVAVEFEQLDSEWYRTFFNTLHPYKDPDWDLEEKREEYKYIKKNIETNK